MEYVISQEGKIIPGGKYLYDHVILTRTEWETLTEERKKAEADAKNLKTLLKITRERANRDRDVRPREQRSGYLFLSTQSRYDSGKKTTMWKTTLQTPYTSSYGEMVNDLVRNDFHSLNLWGRLGLTEYEYLEFRLDSKVGYWVVVVSHCDPCKRIDEDLLPDNKHSRQ